VAVPGAKTNCSKMGKRKEEENDGQQVLPCVAGANRIEREILDACVYLTFEVGGGWKDDIKRPREKCDCAIYDKGKDEGA
jgi:hypothetical protein